MSAPSPTVATIIVNYNTADTVLATLPRLIDELKRFERAPIYIVDNASPNGDYQRLADYIATEGLTAQVSVIDSGANLGFAGGNNVAYEYANRDRAEFLFLLNPDAYPRPGAVSAMIDFLNTHPKAGIVGPALFHDTGEPARSGYRFSKLIGELIYEIGIEKLNKLIGGGQFNENDMNAARFDWVSGAALMINAEAANQPDLMDDDYFLYFEETDMMLDMTRRGWEIWRTPEAEVVHIGGLATGIDARAMRQSIYWYDSWRHYYRKNYGRGYAILAATAKLTGVLCYHFKRVFTQRKNAKPARYAYDILTKCLVPLLRGDKNLPRKP